MGTTKTKSSKPASAFDWHFFSGWDVTGVHDSFVTPGTRKFHTPEAMIVAITAPLMGGKHAKRYPRGTYGTSFTLQHRARVFMGWVIPKGGGTGAPFPDKEFAAELMKRLKRRAVWREVQHG